MTNEFLRPKYEKPWARDLSVISADGQLPLGICSVGNVPYTQCSDGSNVGESKVCEAGTNPGSPGCTPVGFGPTEDPQCDSGSYALIGCRAGGQA